MLNKKSVDDINVKGQKSPGTLRFQRTAEGRQRLPMRTVW